MSAIALNSLASAAATTLYDAIGRAETSAELDKLAGLVWRGYGDGVIVEDDASRLVEYIQHRRPLRRYLSATVDATRPTAART